MRRFDVSAAFVLTMAAAATEARADFLLPGAWNRGAAYTTYQQWETFTTPAGPNAPNGTPTVPAAPHNPNGPADAFDTSGQSFVTGGGNIYSPSAATHIQVALPEYDLGAGYVTTVLFQTRTQGNEPIYTGPGGYRLTYTDGSGPHTLLPARQAELDRQALGGFGGTRVDYAAVFEVPASVAQLKVFFDASASSMSLDRVAVDTIVTRAATSGGPQLAGMSDQIGFVPQAVPEPAGLGLLAAAGGALLARRRRRVP